MPLTYICYNSANQPKAFKWG